ncbi:GAF domain-containing protein [Kineococcus rhizosphaerae]|uniref:GAF domain-containing protein n=1 Tax=Kineococcus rhizosphaerae TaxID=559628 RepID=A0A2T0R8F1_9ACTN|nr:GAF domain-containing protein [Kineococcus rhizosphaerae]PRY17453.1 GAF domain-containing protein [Kineococcus rhizosphaerae]
MAGELTRAREDWLASTAGGAVGTPLPGARELVSSSWWRARTTGLDPDRVLPPVLADPGDVRTRREAHPLAAVLPTARRLLLAEPLGVPVLMAVSDADGTLLWVEGDADLRRAAERMAFTEGARWSEDVVGTNAPGTALALGRPVRVRSAEHYATAVAGWSCSAAPVRDPLTGEVLGVLDLTGGDDLGRERALEFVRAAVGAVEAELRVVALRRRLAPAAPGPTTPRLTVLGPAPALEVSGVARPLSLRHSEILLLLSKGPEGGQSAAQLAADLDDRHLAPVSVRAEVHRLRAVLAERTHGALDLSAAPYRLLGTLRCDVLELRDAVRDGRVREAVRAVTGAVLPGSDAPGVRELREELLLELRACVLEGDDDQALLEFSRTPAARDDVVVARDLLARLAPGDPGRAEAVARWQRLRG